MDFGVVFPTTDIGNDPIAIRDWAQTAEALGYRRITAYDHVLGAVLPQRQTALVAKQAIVDFTGKYHRIDRAGLLPLPARPIPIWFGGSAEPSLARAARLRELLAEQGRDPASFQMDTFLDWTVGEEGWRRETESWESAGGSMISIRTTNAALEMFMRVVRG